MIIIIEGSFIICGVSTLCWLVFPLLWLNLSGHDSTHYISWFNPLRIIVSLSHSQMHTIHNTYPVIASFPGLSQYFNVTHWRTSSLLKEYYQGLIRQLDKVLYYSQIWFHSLCCSFVFHTESRAYSILWFTSWRCGGEWRCACLCEEVYPDHRREWAEDWRNLSSLGKEGRLPHATGEVWPR